MFDIQWGENGAVILSGRWDASQTECAEAFFRFVSESKVVDFSKLEYISSSGLGVLVTTQKRLGSSGGGLKLVNLNHHIADVFRYSGLDQIFEIGGALP
jgi:anti-anti-sigma factor